MYRMIISDIDGTLLPAGRSKIPERVLQALQRAIDQGIEVVIASGRMFSDIPPDIWKLRGLRYVVTCNGASIMDRQENKVIYRCQIPALTAADILRMLEDYRVYSCAYMASGVQNRGAVPAGLDELYPQRREFFRREPHEDLPGWVENRKEPVEKIFVAVLDPSQRDDLRRELSKIREIHVTSSSPRNLEINSVEADKGGALAWLCRHLDIPAEDVIAMGDNENDYNMLSLAGTAVVPANGVEVVLDLAAVAAPDCADCGMAVFLEEQVLRGC